jgi:hypothetical protein
LNDKINRLNFSLEIILTISIFLSSFLVISIEKDWWGGYEEKHNAPFDIKELFKKKNEIREKQDPAYVFENTIRLMIVGCSISFFMVLTLTELAQSLVTTIFNIANKLKQCFKKMSNYISRRGIIYESSLSNRQIAY